MLKVTDFSSHRGGVLSLLPKIHSMFKENAAADKSGTLKNPGHIVTWQQRIKKQLTDINWRFIIAAFDKKLAGVMFYRFEEENAYIEEFQFDKDFIGDELVFDQILKKIEMDKKAHTAVFYVSKHIKLEKNKEILASVGIKDEQGEYEKLGTLNETRGNLKIRFFAGSNSVV